MEEPTGRLPVVIRFADKRPGTVVTQPDDVAADVVA
jgi:hypothetical protein